MSYTNIWKNRILYRTFTNKISGEEVLTSNLSIQGDHRFDSLEYIINDFTQITEFEVSQIDINRIASIDNAAAKSNPRIKIAIVATHEPLLIWIQNYAEKMQTSPFTVNVLNNMEDAHQWVSSRSDSDFFIPLQ